MAKGKRNATHGEETPGKKLESIIIGYLMFFIATRMWSCISGDTWARTARMYSIIRKDDSRSAANNIPVFPCCTAWDYVTITITVTAAVIMILITVTPIIISWYILIRRSDAMWWLDRALLYIAFLFFCAFRTRRCRNCRMQCTVLFCKNVL